ncbi:MAG: ATP-binding protein [Candidatus Latescibacterota bacterium]
MNTIRLPASAEQLRAMLDFIRQGAEAAGLGPKAVKEIMVAVEEPLMNVISYAYPGGGGDVEIAHGAEQERGLVIEITDHGVPFDPLSLPDPDVNAPLEDRRAGGLGIYMMRRMMDEVSYRREEGRNVLTLAKRPGAATS